MSLYPSCPAEYEEYLALLKHLHEHQASVSHLSGPADQRRAAPSGPSQTRPLDHPAQIQRLAGARPLGRRRHPRMERHGERLTIAGDFTDALTAAAQAFPPGTWLDCEALQHRGSIRSTLVILDIVVPDLPWTGRKEVLGASGVPILPWDYMPAKDCPFPHGRLVITDEIPADYTLRAACGFFSLVNTDMGETVFEGVVMKKADSVYPIKTRSPDNRFPYWNKHRCIG